VLTPDSGELVYKYLGREVTFSSSQRTVYRFSSVRMMVIPHEFEFQPKSNLVVLYA